MAEIFQTTILGSSAAIPTSLRHTSAQVVQYHNKRFLLDCAEGTQMQIRRLKLPLMKIDHIFISHLHGDHYLGLPGLLFTFHLLGREDTLHVYAPPGMQQIIDLQYELSQLKPSFVIQYHDLTKGQELLYEDDRLTIETIEMAHRIPAFGFLIREKARPRNIRKGAIRKFSIPQERMQAIKSGEDFVTTAGQVIPNKEITLDPPAPGSYAACSDTLYTESFLDQIKDVDLLYHEATFMHDKATIAREKTHTTTIEAATIAKKAGAKKLLLGHYSARYKELKAFKEEAATVFPNTLMAEEGDVIAIRQDEDPCC